MAMRPSDFMQRNPVKIDISRSKFHMQPRWTGTFNSYELCPIFTYTDVLPGDTFKLSTSFVVRMSTPIVPVMDDLFLDVGFYFVPHKLILSRSYMSPSVDDSNHSWKAFIGAQDSKLNMPIPDGDIELPKFLIEPSGYPKFSRLTDRMGIPAGTFEYAINCLSILAFMAVWNENYREPNVQEPGVFSIVSGVVRVNWRAAYGDSLNHSNNAGLNLPNVCRLHGYFGSCLPWPQRNRETVKMPLGLTAPLKTDGDSVHSFGGSELRLFLRDGSDPLTGSTLGIGNVGEVAIKENGQSYTDGSIGGSNLVVDLAKASAVSINTFRLAVQEQRWYEALARGGNRLDELTAALFGVMPKDAGGDQPEYLGGKRIPLQVSQVNVTANSSESQPTANSHVGNTGAFSLTADSDYYFTKSFDTWGSIIGVCCVRYRDSFGFSLNRMFTRHKRFDFYFPQFANLGEQPVYAHEMNVNEQSMDSDGGFPGSAVFGYQEAYADYRTIPDIVCGEVKPNQSLNIWTYANGAMAHGFSLNLANFLTGVGASDNVDRSLVVESDTSGFQFLAQFQHDIIAVRPMPTYSIPGMVDHH